MLVLPIAFWWKCCVLFYDNRNAFICCATESEGSIPSFGLMGPWFWNHTITLENIQIFCWDRIWCGCGCGWWWTTHVLGGWWWTTLMLGVGGSGRAICSRPNFLSPATMRCLWPLCNICTSDLKPWVHWHAGKFYNALSKSFEGTLPIRSNSTSCQLKLSLKYCLTMENWHELNPMSTMSGQYSGHT